jgi:hypothetical protein
MVYDHLKYGKRRKAMPNLKHLLEELKELDVDPRDIRLPGPLYDDLMSQADDVDDDDDDA